MLFYHKAKAEISEISLRFLEDCLFQFFAKANNLNGKLELPCIRHSKQQGMLQKQFWIQHTQISKIHPSNVEIFCQ